MKNSIIGEKDKLFSKETSVNICAPLSGCNDKFLDTQRNFISHTKEQNIE